MSRIFSGISTTVVKLIIPLLLSIIIPMFFSFATIGGKPLLSAFEQFMLGGLIFLASTLISVSNEVSEMLKLRRQEHQFWDVQNDVDKLFANMRASFNKVLRESSPEENLFAQYFQGVLSEVSASIYMAATKKELRVDELTFGTTDLLLKIMERRARDTLRLVHSLDARPNNFDFSTWARSYYQELTQLAAADKISVRRLFIFGDETDLESPLAQKLFAFHTGNKGYEYRVISRADWMAIVRGNKLPEAHSEFGVWGDMLAYSAIRSSPVHMEGAYYSLPQVIERYREVFDAGWRLGTTLTPTSQVSGTVGVAELFATTSKPGALNSGNASPTP